MTWSVCLVGFEGGLCLGQCVLWGLRVGYGLVSVFEGRLWLGKCVLLGLRVGYDLVSVFCWV